MMAAPVCRTPIVLKFTPLGGGWMGAGGGYAMATFIMLLNWTDQGIRNVKESTKRYEAFKEMAQRAGVTLKDTYWTLGQHDIVAICEAPDEQTAMALLCSLGSQGNVRSQTLRAFSKDEMDAILSKMM
jgi:uncharacterized protein with GYD domain